MKKLITIAGLTLFAGIPAAADNDWIGIQVDSNLYRQRVENDQANARMNNKKRTTKKKTNSAVRPERYPQVQVNGKLLKPAVPAIQIDGTTFVPFRDIFEALGATVQYNAQKRLITATRGQSRMELLVPSSNSVDSKGQSLRSREAPFTRNGVTMVPLRMVSEKMGAKVKYRERQRTPLIFIVSKET